MPPNANFAKGDALKLPYEDGWVFESQEFDCNMILVLRCRLIN
ncbi:4649_t:CDS:1, partial [Funneliformis geosporum]